MDLTQDIFEFQKSKLRSKYREIEKIMKVFHSYMVSKLSEKQDEFQKGSRNARLFQRVLDNTHLNINQVDVQLQCPSPTSNPRFGCRLSFFEMYSCNRTFLKKVFVTRKNMKTVFKLSHAQKMEFYCQTLEKDQTREVDLFEGEEPEGRWKER
jgi:hypothetical protein